MERGGINPHVAKSREREMGGEKNKVVGAV